MKKGGKKAVGKGTSRESTRATVDLTVSPPGAVTSSSMSSSSSSSSGSSSSTAREMSGPRKAFVLHSSPIGGYTSLGTAVKEQVSSISRLPSAFLAPEPAASLSTAASDSHATSAGGTRQTDLPTTEGTQTEQVVLLAMNTMRGSDDDADTETIGRDLVRLIRQYVSQHPEALGRLAGHTPLPDYWFDAAPYCIPAPRSDWPSPPIPVGVDWEMIREEKSIMRT